MPFPNTRQFTPITVGGNDYADVVKDINPAGTDIVGNAIFPSFYFAYDTVNVYFRMRIRSDPRNKAKTSFANYAWGVLLNTTGVEGTYDWLLAVNGRKNRVNLIQNVKKRFNSWTDRAEGTNGRGEPNYSRQIINFDVARVLQADSTFGNTQNYFVDFLIPASTFFSYLDVSPNSPLQMVAFTAANNNNYNKDSLRRSEDYQFKDALSDPVTMEDGNVRARLQITKEIDSGPSSPVAGQNEEWSGSITLTNVGKSQATILNVLDMVNLDVVSSFNVQSTTQGSTAYNQATKTLTWTVGDLEAGQSATLNFVENGLFYTSGNQILNSATGIGYDLFTGGELIPVTTAVSVDVQSTGGAAGNALDNVDGLPEENVNVRLLSGGTEVAVTQTDFYGDYNFTNIPPGTYTLEFTKSNFSTATSNIQITEDNVTILNLYLVPLSGDLQGTVTANDATPINNADVFIANNIGGVVASTTTSPTGQYVIPNIQPGHYVITATANNFQSASIGEDIFPNQTTTTNFVLSPNPGTVQGTISGDGSPLSNANVEVIGATGIVVASTTTNGIGEYVINKLAPGSYRLRGSATSFQTRNIGFTVGSGETEEVNMNLLPNPGSLTGTITDEDTGDPLSEASLKITDAFGITNAHAITDINGQYAVDSLTPGNYVITIAADGRGAKNISAYIEPDQTTELNVSLKKLTGVLTGTVRSDGLPVSGAKVDVVSNHVVMAKTFANSDGTYTISGLSPGRYTVIFTADGYSTTSLGAIIENNETTLLNANIKTIFGTINGLVTKENGDPLPGAVILVNNSDSDVLVARILTNSNGGYNVNDLNPGSYSVTASFTNYQTQLGGAIVTSGNESQLSFSLKPNPSTIIGSVINIDTQEPIKGESIQMQLIDSNGVVLATTFSNIEGEFIFENILPNTYTVNASTDGFRSSYASVKTEPGQTTSTRIGLEPLPGFITGTLTDINSGDPIAGATINISNALGFQVDSMITSTDGHFLSMGLPAGIYTLAVVAEGYETNLVGEIVPWGFTKSIDIQLTPNPGSIRGTVTPIAENTIIQLISMDNQLVNSTAADPTGTFQFQNLAQGNYILKASALNYSIACTGAYVETGSETNVSLTIKPSPGSISGNVINDLGTVLPNVTISLLDANETPIAYGNTDIDGNYYIGNVPPGSYALIAKLMMHTTTTGTVTVSPGQDVTDINFNMARTRGTISGGVFDFTSGSVITGASILLRNSQGILIKYTTTDQFGKFLFRNIGPESYTVTASAPNYSTEISGVIVQSEQTSGLNIALKSLVGNIAGQVTDDKGDPIGGDNVQIKLKGANGELLQALLAQPNGSFIIPNLSEGTYFVTAALEGYTSNLVSVILTPGEINNINIQLSPILTTLSGTVVDSESGNPITGTAVTISLTKNTGVFVTNQYPSETGLFSFNSLSPGIYLLNVNAEGYGNQIVTVTVPESGTDIDIALTKNPGAVTGYVTNQLSSDPLTTAVVTVINAGKSLENHVVTDSYGQFTFPNLSPGSYRALVTAEGFSSQSATFVVLSDQTTSLSFILTPEPGNLLGTITDIVTGAPIPGVNIQVRYLTPAGPVYANTLTDDQGNYQTQGLYAGTYTVIVFADDRYGSSSASVMIPANGTRTVDFALEPFPSTVEGTIRDEATGEPVPNVFVRLLDIHGSSIQVINTDMNGFYRFSGFTSGQYLISAIFPIYQRVQISINPEPGETVIADIFFQPEPGKISGLILDAETGSPLVGAQAEVYSPGSTVPVARRTAGASGDFLIEGVVPGSFTITAYTLNYSEEIKGIIVEPNGITEVEFQLDPDPVTVSGTVLDENDNPLANVSVRIIDENEVEIGNGISDIDGNFAIGNLPSGNFTIIAGIDDYAEFTTGISVQPGEEYDDLNIQMIALGGMFRGNVTSVESSEGIAGVLISILTPEGIPIISTNSDPIGNFVSPLLSPGMYTVIASSPYYVQDEKGVIIVSNQTSEVIFQLEGIGGSIKGRAVNENGNPITNTPIAIRLLNNNGALLQTLQALIDGTFEVLNLSAGTYQVNVIADTYQTTTVGANIKNGEIADLTVPLTLKGGTVEGRIVSSQTGIPIPGSFIEIFDVTGVIVATITSDQNGEFLLTDIQPGALNLKATAPEFSPSSIGIIVEPGEISNTQLTLSPITGLLSGTVMDPDGIPISSSTVQIVDPTNTTVATFITDLDGSYTATLQVDEYTILANATNFGSNSIAGTIRADEETVVNITLTPIGGILIGNIIDVDTETPLTGASVEVRSISPFGPVINNVLTDSEGNYNFGTLSVGTYTIVVTKDNYGDKSGSVLIENGVTHTHDFSLSLNPSSISGTVTTGSVPLTNVLIRLVDTSGANVFEVQTDEQGQYLIENFKPGSYALLVNHVDYQTGKQGFTSLPGEAINLDFDLIAQPGSLIGTIFDEEGSPLPGALIQVFYADSLQPANRAITDPEGSYVISGLAPGNYTLTMTSSNYKTFTTGAIINANETITIDGFLAPDPGVISGTVTGTEGPLEGAAVKVIDVNGSSIGSGITDGDGTFSIGNLPVGTFAVTILAANHHSISQGVTISPGEFETLSFTLVPEPGSIAGTVLDENGTPISGTVINVLLNGLIIGSNLTDENGSYSFQDLQPQSYQLTADQPGYGMASIGAVVISNETATANFNLLSIFGVISGTVTDSDGNPLNNKTIYLNVFDQNDSFVYSVLAQPDGTFSIPEVKPGDYLLTVTTEGYESKTSGVSVEPDEVTDLTVPLSVLGGNLSVQVIEDDTSVPIPGVITDIYNETGIPITSGVTDQEGKTTFEKLPEGQVVVSAVAPNYTNASKGAIIESGVTKETTLAVTPETGELQGTLTAPSGEQLAGVTIQILDSKRSVVTTVLTQTDGGFAVFDLAPGIYTMLINHPGYEQQSLSAYIEAGQTSRNNLIIESAPGSVEGIVTDTETGAFLSRTNVELRLISPSGPVIASTLTDSQGHYRFLDITSGNYTVIATHRLYGADAEFISVQMNSTTFADLQLARITTSINGTVRNSEGDQPLQNTLLRIANQGGTVIAEIQTDVSGRFTYEGLMPGEYSIAALNTDYRSQIVSFLAEPGSPSLVDFNLQAFPSQFTGTVIDAETELPIIGALVEAYDLLDRPVAAALTNINGVYTLPALNDGTYTLRASAQGYSSMSRFSSLLVNDSKIENFILSVNPASVSGSVTSIEGQPLNNATVTVADQNGIVVGNTSTNENGTYFIGNLPAGVLTVTADADGYLTVSIELAFERGENKDGINFALSPGADGEIKGQVTNSRTREPLPGVLIQLNNENGAGVEEVTSNSEGVYAFSGIPAGTYRVRASRDGYLSYNTTVQLRPDEELLLLISLSPDSPAPGRTGVNQYYIILGGKYLTLENSDTSPTLFTLVNMNEDKTCATFAFIEIVDGSRKTQLILFDLSHVILVPVH
ncbi:carboxypeptidase regulatory-like domain-containing protein [Pseudalkalibacillus sp. Hm43]|uniref:carboxypeptidase regulatory-like domain-containing protein n=1 Tax=Pseudalkalibacillus sp. Hm43 TaxID=3450742 RepID=UPI003F41E8C1